MIKLLSFIILICFFGPARFLAQPAGAPPASRLPDTFPPRAVWGDYDAILRGADGHVDVGAMVTRLQEIHANTYLWLLYGTASDWTDLPAFLPKAAQAGINVWVYLVPPSEPPAPNPFEYDFPRWGEEIAKLSLQHSNLTAWVIDDFYANKSFFTPQLVRDMQTRAKSINPRLAFLPLMYFPELGAEFLKGYGGAIDGVVVAYPRDRDEIEKAYAILNGLPWTDFEFALGHRTPSKAGDFISAKQQAEVLSPGSHRLRFRELGGYPGTPAGYHIKELRVDDTVVWSQDAADGRPWWHDVDVDVTPQVQGRKRVTLGLQLVDRKGVSDFPITWNLRDLSAEGLQLDADFKHPEKWKVEKQGAFQAGFGSDQPPGKGGFHIPFIVMTAAQDVEFKGRHGPPGSPERIAEWLRFCLTAHRSALCDGVVTYAMDKNAKSPIFEAVRREYLSFEKAR